MIYSLMRLVELLQLHELLCERLPAFTSVFVLLFRLLQCLKIAQEITKNGYTIHSLKYSQ